MISLFLFMCSISLCAQWREQEIQEHYYKHTQQVVEKLFHNSLAGNKNDSLILCMLYHLFREKKQERILSTIAQQFHQLELGSHSNNRFHFFSGVERYLEKEYVYEFLFAPGLYQEMNKFE